MTSEVHEKDLGGGIDARNSENSIGPSFWETLINAETDGNLVKKRKGYQQLGGYLPFRVQSIEFDETNLCFNLDSYVDLSRVRSSPIVVRGTAYYSGNTHVDFPDSESSEKYYNDFDVTIRRNGVLSGPIDNPTYDFTVPAAAHGHNSWLQHANVYLSTSETNLSNELIFPRHRINSPDLTTTELSDTEIQVNQDLSFIHASIDASELGPSHYYPNSSGVPTFTSVLNTEPTTPLVLSFDALSENLLSSNLIITVYEKISANTVEKIIPDDITITGTGVDITILPSGLTGTTQEFIYVATAVPDSNVLAGQVFPGSQTVSLPASPFTSFSIYTVTGGVREYVYPDTAIYDDTAQELTITFNTNEAVNYQIYYTQENLRVNQICVDTPNASVGASSTIELDLYGLDPLEVIDIENRNHWLTHIDTYRSAAQILGGVSGNEYILESTNLDTLYPRFENVLEDAQYLVPYFQSSGQTFIPEGRGYLTMDNGFAGPEVISTQYIGPHVRFTLRAPNVSMSEVNVGAGPSEYVDEGGGLFSSVLESDEITISNVGYSVMNGTHTIDKLTVDTINDLIYIDCTIENVSNSDFDEIDAGGYAQIYTAPLTINSSALDTNTLIPGSTISLSTRTYTVRGNSIDGVEKLLLGDVVFNSELSSGLFMLGTHDAKIVPTRTNEPSISEYVRGDMVKYTSFDRWIKIEDIIQLDTQNVTLSGNLLTFSSEIALNLQANQSILLILEGLEGGVFTVNRIVNPTTIELDRSVTATSGRFIGKCLQLDESISVSDTVSNSLGFTPTARWNSIQKPSVPSLFDVQDKVVQYPFNAFQTNQQAIIRSTIVSDNMYLTNGEDAVLKYDGANLSRAGLFRWEGGVFIRKVDGSSGAIPLTAATAEGTTSNGSKVFATDEAALFTPGQIVKMTVTGTVTITSVDVTNGKVVVDTPLVAGDTVMKESSTLKYYVRLNMIDGNNNIIGSAATGSDGSYTIQMEDNTTVGIKLAKPPKLPMMDYARLEYEIYRTKQDGSIFFKVVTLPISNENTNDYVYFEDTVADISLTEADPVSVSTVGAELATAIDEPLRAKYITSANNRLILGNLKDSPRAEVQIYRPSTEANLQDLTFTFTNTKGEINYKFLNSSDAVTAIATDGTLTTGKTLTADYWYYLYINDNNDLSPEPLGWFRAESSTKLKDYTGGAYSLSPDVFIVEGDENTIPIYAGAEFSDDDSAYQSGNNQLMIPAKLVNAINATQFHLNNFSLSGEGKTDSAQLGRFSIRSLDNSVFNMSITGADLFSKASIFVNNNPVASGETVQSVETKYASRMLVSFPNFAEISDRPRAIIPEDSLSVIDVNSADGQEITGIIPFFGESTSQDSRKQDIVICFKENSIYAVNVTTRVITKIDSRGIGCNAPNSIAAVPNGIIFVSRSGVYRLNRSFDVIWIGRYLDRVWQNTNLNKLDLVTGHVYPQEKQYRLSVPVNSDEQAADVYVYEYGDEAAGQVGAWTTFTNIPSTGWASDGINSFFGSWMGKVFTIRNTGTDSDYRDDNEPVLFEGVYRGLDFGSPGRRKLVRAVISHFRVLKTDSNTKLEVGVDLTDEFRSTEAFTLQDRVEDGLSTIIGSKVKSVRQNFPVQKGIYFQVKYSNGAIDTPVALAGITFRVMGLDYTGITSAADT